MSSQLSLVDLGDASDVQTFSLESEQNEGPAGSQKLSSLLDRTVGELRLKPPMKAAIILHRALVSMRLVVLPQVDQADLADAVNLEMESYLGEEVNSNGMGFHSLG